MATIPSLHGQLIFDAIAFRAIYPVLGALWLTSKIIIPQTTHLPVGAPRSSWHFSPLHLEAIRRLSTWILITLGYLQNAVIDLAYLENILHVTPCRGGRKIGRQCKCAIREVNSAPTPGARSVRLPFPLSSLLIPRHGVDRMMMDEICDKIRKVRKTCKSGLLL